MAYTLQEFEEMCSSISGLISFCNDVGYDHMENIYDDYCYNDMINENLEYWIREYSWEELLGILDNLPKSADYNWFYCGDYDWEGLNEGDVESWYDDVLQDAIQDGYVIDEDSEDDEDEDGVTLKVYATQNDNEIDEDFLSILNLEVA